MSENEVFNMYFGIIEDHRCEVNVVHPLVDILKLVMIAILCGMDELDKIIDYGENKKEFLKKEFNIKLIPSKSTLTRVIATINPKWLSLSIVCILNTLIKNNPSQIMLDGKAIKSTDAIKTIETMMNIVTAYTDTGISLGQITVDSKSNEIPAVRELIKMLNIEGMVITADAMHCQKETAETIIKNKGDYVLQLKANQGNFYKDVYAMFDDKYMNEADKDCEYETFSTTEISCYLSSKNTTAENLLSYTRKHWEIESMHHILDVTYDEDRCKLLTQRAQENLNIFRKTGISIHKNYLKEKKQTVKSNMFNCLLNDNLLLEVIGNITNCNNR